MKFSGTSLEFHGFALIFRVASLYFFGTWLNFFKIARTFSNFHGVSLNFLKISRQFLKIQQCASSALPWISSTHEPTIECTEAARPDSEQRPYYIEYYFRTMVLLFQNSQNSIIIVFAEFYTSFRMSVPIFDIVQIFYTWFPISPRCSAIFVDTWDITSMDMVSSISVLPERPDEVRN